MKVNRYDYEGDEFYENIKRLASAGMTDKEIALRLGFTQIYFSQIKNGKVSEGSEENAQKIRRRSERIKEALREGRTNITATLHALYLNVALGKIVTKTKVKKMQEVPCACGGSDPNCQDCGGTGRIVTDMGIIQESEIQQPPSLQAITTLLNVFDPDWKGGVTDETAAAQGGGIDIRKWIEAESEDKKASEGVTAGGKEGDDDTDA